jgi:hypothetical protein
MLCEAGHSVSGSMTAITDTIAILWAFHGVSSPSVPTQARKCFFWSYRGPDKLDWMIGSAQSKLANSLASLACCCPAGRRHAVQQ